jgi:hypothetical protein
MIAALRQNASLSMGIDHPAYDVSSGPITGPVKDSLIGDLASNTVA